MTDPSSSQTLSRCLWGWNAVWEALPWSAGGNAAEHSLLWAVLGQKAIFYRFWLSSRNQLARELLLLENNPPSNQVQGVFFCLSWRCNYLYYVWWAIVWSGNTIDSVVGINFTQRMWRHLGAYCGKAVRNYLTLHLSTCNFAFKQTPECFVESSPNIQKIKLNAKKQWTWICLTKHSRAVHGSFAECMHFPKYI